MGYFDGDLNITDMTNPLSDKKSFLIPGYLQQFAPKLNTTFPRFDFSLFNMLQPVNNNIPAAYETKTFDKDAKFREMYGTQASRRDKRRFNKYWNSEQRWDDQNAFEAQEHLNFMDNLDARWKAIGDKVGQLTATSVADIQNSLNSRWQDSQQTIEQPKTSRAKLDSLQTPFISEQQVKESQDKANQYFNRGVAQSSSSENNAPEPDQDWHWYNNAKKNTRGQLMWGSGWRDRHIGDNFYNYGNNRYRIVVNKADDQSYLVDLTNGKYIQADENMWGRIDDDAMNIRLRDGSGWKDITKESGLFQYKIGGIIKLILKNSNVFPYNLL